MKKKVTLRELLGARLVLAICIAVYYWCWARNDWEDYFSSIQQCVAIFAFLFFCFLAVRERKYKKETVDEMAAANLKRCDSICYKITMVLIVCIAFLSAILRFTISPEIIGYMLMGVLVLTAIIRMAIFCYMDAKGI
ncbi:MAG TPA: hypothetical protein DEF14_05720 [Ruminococcaceae bacterium]|nr:hypothetical protein [Oscillospiraceae bacterium]